MLMVPYARVWQNSGFSRLSGTAMVAGTPDVAVACRVQILTADPPPRHVATAFSVGGEWSIEGIRIIPGGYTAIGYDHTGVHDPAAKTGLIPTPMPPDPAEHP